MRINRGLGTSATEAQKELAAGLVLGGDKPAICITEPAAGGGVSRLHLIFARVFDDGVEQGIGGFLVVRCPETGAPAGLTIGEREPAMGLRAMPETQVILDDLKVPAGMLLLPPGGLRRGFAGLMNAYNGQRVGAATVALGIAQGAFELALEAARLMIWRAACSTNEAGFPDTLLAAQAKILASETSVKVTNEALQLFGAAGYSRNLPLERMVRDARMFTIGGGTAQILRTVVASGLLGQRLPQTRDGYLQANLERPPDPPCL